MFLKKSFIGYFQIVHIEGVIGFTNLHAWQLKSGANVVSVHVRVYNEVNEQLIRQRIYQMFKKYGFTQITVQIEKGALLNHNNHHHHNSAPDFQSMGTKNRTQNRINMSHEHHLSGGNTTGMLMMNGGGSGGHHHSTLNIG